MVRASALGWTKAARWDIISLVRRTNVEESTPSLNLPWVIDPPYLD
jgi:hypothetical protein